MDLEINRKSVSFKKSTFLSLLAPQKLKCTGKIITTLQVIIFIISINLQLLIMIFLKFFARIFNKNRQNFSNKPEIEKLEKLEISFISGGPQVSNDPRM